MSIHIRLFYLKCTHIYLAANRYLLLFFRYILCTRYFSYYFRYYTIGGIRVEKLQLTNYFYMYQISNKININTTANIQPTYTYLLLRKIINIYF